MMVTTFLDDIFKNKAYINIDLIRPPEGPNWPTVPPPHPPNSGNLVLFFRTSKTTFCAYERRKKIDYDNDGCNDNYDDNYGNFDDNYDKND